MRFWPSNRQNLAHVTLIDERVTRAEGDNLANMTEPAKAEQTVMEQWQDLVLRYADRIPIVNAGARYYSSAVQQTTYDLLVADTEQAVEGDNPAFEIVKILEQHRDEMGQAVELMFLIGETRQTYDGRVLKTYGAGELTRKNGRYGVIDEKGKIEDLPPGTHAWRTWDPDRRFQYKATSSHKSMLDLLEAFVIALAEERAVSVRAAMNTGMVIVSEELFNLPGMDTQDPNATEGSDPRARLERRFKSMLQMVIKNPRNAASFAPPVMVARGLGVEKDVSKLVAHVSFAQDRDKRKIAERLDMLKREYAVAVDLPADVAAGFLADLNHWNSRSVDSNAWKNYISPKIKLVANSAFQEVGRALGISTENLTLRPNGNDLIEPEVRAENALRAWDRGLISNESARRASGFDEADKPDDEANPKDNTSEGIRPGDGLSFAADEDKAPNLDRLSDLVQDSAVHMREVLFQGIDETAAEIAATELAAGDPIGNLIELIQAALLRQKSEMGLAAARTLATKAARQWYDRTRASHEDNAYKAALATAGLLRRIVRDKKYSVAVARDLVRHAESLGVGGLSNIDSSGEVNLNRPSVAQEDPLFMRLLQGEISGLGIGYEWQHGDSADPFPAHLDLNGKTWTQPEEREVLDNSEEFPASSVFYPGDHKGCTCNYKTKYEVLT